MATIKYKKNTHVSYIIILSVYVTYLYQNVYIQNLYTKARTLKIKEESIEEKKRNHSTVLAKD